MNEIYPTGIIMCFVGYFLFAPILWFWGLWLIIIILFWVYSNHLDKKESEGR